MVDTIYCEKCDDFVKYEVKNKEETYTVKGEEIKIDAKVAYCKNCRKEIFYEELDKENQRKVFDIYRERHNLLSPEDIKDIRLKYSLNQREMSQLLGWGEITCHRYENGAAPDSAHNNQLLLMKDPNNVKKLLKDGTTKLDPDKKEKLLDTVNELLNSKNKLEIHLPKAFYNELKMKANNNDMWLDEYVSFLITKEYHEEKTERKIQQYESSIKRQIFIEQKEQEAESNWLEDLDEGIEDVVNLPSRWKKKITIN